MRRKSNWLIGTEHEIYFKKIIIKDYNGQFGIGKILDQFHNDNWSEIKEGDNLIGLKHVSDPLFH